MFKYESSCPLVHGVGLNSVAVPVKVPMRSNDNDDGLGLKLLGIRISRRRFPVPPPSIVKPKSIGGLLVVGLFEPLSTHCEDPAQYPCIEPVPEPCIGLAQHD